MPLAFTRLSLASAVGACFGYATSFVLSLYLGDVRLPRDHPITVRRRIVAVSILTAMSPVFLWLLADTLSVDVPGLLETIGIRHSNLLFAIGYPLALVSLLYLGPLVQRITDVSSEEMGIIASLRGERVDILLRNFVVAPIAEELVFRSCMVPLLLPHLGHGWTVLLCPLFFGLAHIHHMFEHVKAGSVSLPQALLNVLIQTTYTSLFGMFSAHLFLQTGHVTSAIVAHAFCNVLGLPEVHALPHHKYKWLIGALYFVGFGCFVFGCLNSDGLFYHYH